MARIQVSSEIQRALNLMSEHPSVESVDAPHINNASGVVTVDLTFAINLPSEWRLKGESPSGVRSEEKVRFTFYSTFPLYAPVPSLRIDFNRNLPHIQPWLLDGRTVPCIYDGNINELFHLEGLRTILNQTAVWLNKAACDALIDSQQGWEPVRRDSLHDFLIADANFLRNLVDRRGGHQFLETYYSKSVGVNNSPIVLGQITSTTARPNRESIDRLFYEMNIQSESSSSFGKSLTIVVWPGKHPSGKLVVNDTYHPETVNDVNSLRQRADDYGCKKELNDSLNLLRRCLYDKSFVPPSPYTVAVILMVRRPFTVIGSTSSIELCPYVMEIQPSHLFADGRLTVVRAAAHQNPVSRNLLARMSGLAPEAESRLWALVGAGSLGSKIALHLARAGNGPSTIIDNSSMTPHNAARHGFVPSTNELPPFLLNAKARILTQVVGGLNQKANAIVADVAEFLISRKNVQDAWLKENWMIVNATASALARETFGASDKKFGRVIEMSLFGGGRLGIVTVEGAGRNPSTTDLIAEFYSILREKPSLASIVFSCDDLTSYQNTGQGCGSLTMTMTDSRISLFAAGMSEYLLTQQQKGLPKEHGEILIGELSNDGLGLAWNVHRTPPTTVVPTNKKSWSVHVHSRAVAKMKKEVSLWPDVETGGVLIGRSSELSRVTHVVDVIEAPKDSRRANNDFTLGTMGLQQRIQEYSETINYSLYCLGTWHSHLSPSGPSDKDIATAKAVASTQLTPSIFLVMEPKGFHALAEGV